MSLKARDYLNLVVYIYMEIRELLPKNKFDNSNINRLFLLTDEEIKPIIYELLEWTQDYNWPIAKEIIPVLLEREDLIFPYIREILQSNDEEWIYWIIKLLLPSFSASHKNMLKDEIVRLTNSSEEDYKENVLEFCHTYFNDL